MNISRFTKRAVSFLLALIFTVSLLPAGYVYAEQDFSADFGDPDGSFNISVAPSTLLAMLCPDATEQELLYADSYFEGAPIYGAGVYADGVQITLDSTRLTVTAPAKGFTANNSQAVTWTPEKLRCGDTEVDFSQSGNDFTASLEDPAEEFVTLTYTTSLTLPADYVDSLVNFAYNDITAARLIAEQNGDAMEKYLEECRKYKEYLDAMDSYAEAQAKYDEYLRQKQLYEQRLSEYNTYLSLLEKYTAEYAAYEKYLAEKQSYDAQRLEYEQNFDKNMAAYEEYRAYIINLSKIRSSMEAIESLYITPSNGVGSLFQALQNEEIVGMIERHQNSLITLYGVKKSDITDMRVTSDALNELLHGYNGARERSEEEAFNFYKQNHAQITEKFNYLYQKMTLILNKTIFTHVCALLESVEYKDDPEMAEYKKWRIKNVLCHIYLVCNALDDSKTSDTVWTFYHEGSKELYKYSYSDLLAQNVILSDTNCASPASLEWMNGEYKVTQMPTPPTPPAEVAKPTQPREVTKPEEPTATVKPTQPERVLAPSNPPTQEGYDIIRRTEETFGDITPAKRVVTSDASLPLRREVIRPYSTDGTPLKIHYNYDGTVIPGGTVPTRPDSDSHTYIHSGEWREIESGHDTLLVARYTATPKEYTVSFKNGDTLIYTAKYKHGQVPQYTGSTPERASTHDTSFRFSGWYPKLSAVRSDTTYEAQFEGSERLYSISWSVLGRLQSRELSYGEAPVPPSIPAVQYIDGVMHEFIGWNATPSPVTQSTVYTALFNSTPLVSLPAESLGTTVIYKYQNDYIISLSGETKADINGLLKHASKSSCGIIFLMDGITLRANADAVYSLYIGGAQELILLTDDSGTGYRFTNSQGGDVLFVGKITMSLENTQNTQDLLYIAYTSANGRKGYTSCSASAQTIEFSANPSALYSLHRYYRLTVKSNEGGAVLCDKTLYRQGDTVSFKTLPNTEYKAVKITVTDSSGNITEISSSSFEMPADNITLTAEFAEKLYTVRFISEDEIISEEEYRFGDTIKIPVIQTSFEKDGFSYSFIGWSQPINIVTDDITFTAKYVSVRNDISINPETDTATEIVGRQLLPIVALAVVLLCCCAAFIIVCIRLHKKKGKKNEKKI